MGATTITAGGVSFTNAMTTRTVPDGVARARYGLHGWTGDVSARYAVTMGANWQVLPHVGGTVIHDIRKSAAETGGCGFALAVARGRAF